MLKDLVDRYATESDRNNQDYYVEIFRPELKLKVYFGDNVAELLMRPQGAFITGADFLIHGGATASYFKLPPHLYDMQRGNN